MPQTLSFVGCLLFVWQCTASQAEEMLSRHRFDRQRLTDVYYSEGVSVGDIDHDGEVDVVHGPFWFKGPEFVQKFEIYPAQPQDRQRYADNFFSWIHDFNQDGWNDVLTVGFPGTPAYVYENPGQAGFADNWTRHEIFDWVSNESPQFTNLVGDERPELVCTRDGYFGYASIDWERPFDPWTFHAISEQTAPPRFGHGLGVGDVNGDGRLDMLMKDGWFEQPDSLTGDPLWALHNVPFAPAGGADMFAYDVDGDGDNDVITSLAAHEFGLAWWEQSPRSGADEGQRSAAHNAEWTKHLIMGSTPEENRYGVVFSELHTVGLADMDGDGLQDIVTGKTYWSHHTQSPMWDAGAVVYWFKLVRGSQGVDWVPYLADGEAGVGRQVVVTDVNADNLPDIVTGGMKGAHVLRHVTEAISAEEALSEQPREIHTLMAGLTPEEAVAQMTVPPGFTVTLGAGEPQVHQPIAFTMDDRGRVWVAEAYTYPIRAPEGEGRDRIIILEDTDQDGTLDSRKVFTEGLNLVSGMEVGFGGVWVGAAPYLLFIPDRDGDDHPDGDPQVLLDGFGYEDTHETLNSFNWGPDGWLYGCHGVFTHSRVGAPGTPDDERTPLNAGVWRYHPTQHKFEVFAWGTSNPWGVDFDDYGQAFITACVIPHLYHVIQGGYYQRQAGRHFNPYVYDDIQTIAVHRHYAGDIRDHAWWGQEPDVPLSTLAAGGGHAHCGALVYLGDNWPDRYRNQVFMHNIHGNRINNDVVTPVGSGYSGNRAPDLMLANDKWFRGISLRTGPDGTVWLIDWYDRNACHRRTPEIWDRTNGRIYNIAYGTPPRTAINLGQLSSVELARLQLHKNDWYVRTARRLLQERAANGMPVDDAEAELRGMLANSSDETRRLRALWALYAIGRCTTDDSLKLLHDPGEYVRAWVIQLELEDGDAIAPLREELAKLAQSDPSPVVRLYLASALQRLPLDQRWGIAESLATHAEDADDHNLPLLDWYGIEPLVPANPPRALALANATTITLLQRFILRRLAADDEGLNGVVALLVDADDERRAMVLAEMLSAFEGRVGIKMPAAWSVAYEQLQRSPQEELQQRADRVAVILGDKRAFPRLRTVMTDSSKPLDERQAALETLVRGQDAESAVALQQVLHEPALRGAAIRALALFDHPQTAAAIISQYAAFDDGLRRDAVSTLASRRSSARALLDAIENGMIPRTDVHAYHVEQLTRLNDAALKEQLEQVWGTIRETSADSQEQMARLKQELTPAALRRADASHGRATFQKTCAACHTLFGEGGKIGPDLTGSDRANVDYVLQNIVDPSAVLGKDYRQTVVLTDDGRVVSGLIENETDSALTIRTINDTIIVPIDSIESRVLSDKSMMPDRLLEPLPGEAVRDLVAYLASPTQVPLRGPEPPIDAKTGRVPDALEGESFKVLGATAGAARSQKMGGFNAARWSGGDQLWWTGGQPGARLEVELPVERGGPYALEVVFTKARDYAIVRLSVDDEPWGEPIDLFNVPEVISSGVLMLPARELEAGIHRLTFEVAGANPAAEKAFMVGIDYVRLVRESPPAN